MFNQLLPLFTLLLIGRLIPVVRTGTPPAVYVNLAFTTLMVVGLALSLWRRSSPQLA